MSRTKTNTLTAQEIEMALQEEAEIQNDIERKIVDESDAWYVTDANGKIISSEEKRNELKQEEERDLVRFWDNNDLDHFLERQYKDYLEEQEYCNDEQRKSFEEFVDCFFKE